MMMLSAISKDEELLKAFLPSPDNDDDGDSPDSNSESDNDDQIMSKFWDNGDDDDDDDDDFDLYSFGDKDNDKDDILDNDDEVEEMKRSLYPNYGWDQIKETQIFAELPIKRITNSTSTTSTTTTFTNKDYTRIVCISDTYGNHRDIPHIPKGDILIHGGDFSKSGEIGTIQDLAKYFNEHQQNPPQNNDSDGDDDGSCDGYDRIICIAGNDDMTLDEDYYDMNWY
jgi:hypothetical protein